MTTNDDSIEWVVERLQALQQEHEEARRANRVVDHAACRIASETYLQDLLRAHTRLDEARAEVERLQAELQRAYDAKSQQAVYAGEHADRAEAYRVACLQAEAEVERLKAEIQPRIERSIAFQDAMEEAEAERDEARAEVMRLQGQVETRDIIIYQVAWQMQAVATAIGMTPEEQAASAEGIGDAIAERVTRLQAERDADYHEGYRAGQEDMQDRCAALCDDWEADSYCEGWREMEIGAQHCAEAIRALEVEP